MINSCIGWWRSTVVERRSLTGDWLGTRQQLAKLSMSPLQIKNQVIMPLDKVRDLGVIIDSKLTMESHTASVARSCFYQLRQLRSIQRSLTTDARRTLVTAFVANRVYYCNAVLYGTSTSVTRRLQMVLNSAARKVVGLGKYEHITPVFRDNLHWLPVTARIQFKIAALTFDCVRGTGPVYLKQAIWPVSE